MTGGEYDKDDVVAGSLYDNGLAVFSFGLMGQNLDDIGQSIAGFVRLKFPGFKPQKILDLGCTVGHNTGAWKDNFPDAEVHAIDVAAPCLRYGHARAQAQGRAIHFHQMNAEKSDFPDASFDVVFSSMFLHEVPRKGIEKVFAEAHRLLRPGGLMLHMELPPNSPALAVRRFLSRLGQLLQQRAVLQTLPRPAARGSVQARRLQFEEVRAVRHAVDRLVRREGVERCRDARARGRQRQDRPADRRPALVQLRRLEVILNGANG